MTVLRRLLATTATGVLMLGTAGVAMTSIPSTASADVSCHYINAKGNGQDLGGGQTRADIIGAGLLQGTTAAQFAASPTTDAHVLRLAGTVTFTTNNGTLTVAVTGSLNTDTGDFTASGPVTDSSGRLAGTTGQLAFAGTEDLATGAFTEAVNGSICADLAP